MMNWDMTPVKGSSGNAYTARIDQERLFIKKNGSPFLSNIYLEGITPKVLWTRRTAEGDTLSAQPWISGHTLSPDDMTDRQINRILSHLHRSRKLIEAYKKLGNAISSPQDLLDEAVKTSPILSSNHYLSRLVDEMYQTLPVLNSHEVKVVHGDVNHKNWMLEDGTGKIYLVDWDTVFLSDPMVDIAHVLSHYIKPDDWNEWLKYSGYLPQSRLMKKIEWYGKLSYLRQISVEVARNDVQAVNEEIIGLRAFCGLF